MTSNDRDVRVSLRLASISLPIEAVYSPSPARPSEWRRRRNSRVGAAAATTGRCTGGAAATAGRRGSTAGQHGGGDRWPARRRRGNSRGSTRLYRGPARQRQPLAGAQGGAAAARRKGATLVRRPVGNCGPARSGATGSSGLGEYGWGREGVKGKVGAGAVRGRRCWRRHRCSRATVLEEMQGRLADATGLDFVMFAIAEIVLKFSDISMKVC
uniref:Uncharacterized protein n=1 Tax=Oryza glumipatula TaxID=40148 RepID=A0A0E0AWC7_9ORYZ